LEELGGAGGALAEEVCIESRVKRRGIFRHAPSAVLPSKNKTVFPSLVHAGGSPAATHFLCFAKESKQRKATAKPLPCGFPLKHLLKRETK